MRRLAMGAVLGVIAFASPVDSGSSGAAPHNVRRTAMSAAPDRTAELAARRAATVAAPSAEDDMQAMADARAARERVEAARQRAARNARRSGPATAEGVWRALGGCESHNNPRAVSSSGKYRGAFQFSIPTWRSLGYDGDPIEHSYATQLQAAKRLQARSGWGQWPSCARRLGLL